MNSRPIILENLTPIASGNNRDVFAHPDDPDLLIKVVKSDVVHDRNGSSARWTKRFFRRYKHYQTFLRECQEHIVSRLDQSVALSFVHAVVGFVDTDRGLGLVTRAEKDQAGAYAKTFAKLIEEGGFDEQAQRAYEQFRKEFIASSVIVTDLSLKNIVYSYKVPDAPCFVLVDGYGEKNLIPFNSLFRRCHMSSKRKRMARLARTVQRAIDRRQKVVKQADESLPKVVGEDV